MAKKSTLEQVFHDKKTISYVFLGVGLVLFVMNLTSLITTGTVSYSKALFNVSVFSSMIIILFAVYNIFE